MRWLTFGVFAVVTITFQTAVVPRLALFGVRPDWLLIAVVFLALNAPAKDAVIGAWLLGGLADLMTLERFGLLALSYGLAALIVVSMREYLFRNRRVTQFVVTLLICLLIRTVWIAYQRLAYDPSRALYADFAGVLMTSVYTAGWAPLLLAGLQRTRGLFGFPPPRYSYAGLHRLGAVRV